MDPTRNLHITKITSKSKILEIGKGCEKCGNCCRYDSGIVLKEEIPNLAKSLDITEEQLIEKYLDEHEKFNTKHYKFKQVKLADKPYGECVFYDKQAGCTINDMKPLHCRTGTCNEHGEQITEWFALNFFVNPDDPESVRQWATKLVTHPTIPGGEINSLIKSKEELKKILKYDDLVHENEKNKKTQGE
jgi:Fe-S-cluster containining protein